MFLGFIVSLDAAHVNFVLISLLFAFCLFFTCHSFSLQLHSPPLKSDTQMSSTFFSFRGPKCCLPLDVSQAVYFYLLIYDRVQTGDGQRGGQRIQRCGARTHETRDHDLSQGRNQSGAPIRDP